MYALVEGTICISIDAGRIRSLLVQENCHRVNRLHRLTNRATQHLPTHKIPFLLSPIDYRNHYTCSLRCLPGSAVAAAVGTRSHPWLSPQLPLAAGDTPNTKKTIAIKPVASFLRAEQTIKQTHRVSLRLATGLVRAFTTNRATGTPIRARSHPRTAAAASNSLFPVRSRTGTRVMRMWEINIRAGMET